MFVRATGYVMSRKSFLTVLISCKVVEQIESYIFTKYHVFLKSLFGTEKVAPSFELPTPAGAPHSGSCRKKHFLCSASCSASQIQKIEFLCAKMINFLSNEIEMADFDGGFLLSPMADSNESLISETSARNDRAKADLLELRSPDAEIYKIAEEFYNSRNPLM